MFRSTLAVLLLLAILLPTRATARQTVGTVSISTPVLVSSDMADISHAEPHLAVNPLDPDHMIAAVAVFPDSAGHRVDLVTSRDGGLSWERQILPQIADTESLDPWIAFGPDGNPKLTVLVHDHARMSPTGNAPVGILVLRSRDGGDNWTDPTIVSYGMGGSYDQQKATMDHTEGRYGGRLYVAANKWGPRTEPGNLTTQSLGVLASDNGISFRGPDEIGANNVHKSSVQPVVLSDGALVLLYTEWGSIDEFHRTDLIWAVHSTDGGATYSAPYLVSAWASLGFTDATTALTGPLRDRVIASWLEDVELTPVRSPVGESFELGAARRLTVAHSDVLGTRWSNPVTVTTSEVGTQLVHHRIAAAGDGSVAIAWTEATETEDRRCHRWYVAISPDGGDTFTEPTRIGDPACHSMPGDAVMFTMGHEIEPILPRFGRGGDYFGFVGLPDGGYQLMWATPQNDVLQLWSARIELESGGTP